MADLAHPFQGFRLYVLGAIAGQHQGKARTVVMFDIEGEDGRRFQQTADELGRMGYRVTVMSSCLVRLDRHPWQGYAYCRGTAPAAPGVTPGAAPASSVPFIASR